MQWCRIRGHCAGNDYGSCNREHGRGKKRTGAASYPDDVELPPRGRRLQVTLLGRSQRHVQFRR